MASSTSPCCPESAAGRARSLPGGSTPVIPAPRSASWTPAGLQSLATTRPYYRSTYVFVTRRSESLQLRSFDDPVLRGLRIGVQLAGGAEGTTPPVYALARRGLMDQVEGYSLYADYARPNPPARVLDALARGEVDVAVTWGPLAGYFAPREPVRLRVSPVAPAVDASGVPLTFAIA